MSKEKTPPTAPAGVTLTSLEEDRYIGGHSLEK